VFGGAGVGGTGELNFGIDANTVDLNDTSGLTIRAESEDALLGTDHSNLGDINGDGIDDLIIEAPGFEGANNRDAGAAFVLFGGGDVGSNSDLTAPSSFDGQAGFSIIGENDLMTIDSVSGAGDINGDGLADMIIGSRGDSLENPGGRAYIIFGSADVGSSGLIDLAALDASAGFKIIGNPVSDRFADTVSAAGDLNNDGMSDVAITVPFAGTSLTPDDAVSTGPAVYVVFGASDVGGDGDLEISELDGYNGFVINGLEGILDEVSEAGDVNGDGVSDLIFGMGIADPNGIEYAGKSYVVYGADDLGESGAVDVATLNGENGFMINGFEEDGLSGRAVSEAGDVNGDGVSDVIISIGRTQRSAVVFGSTDVGGSGVFELLELDGTNGFLIDGSASDMRFGVGSVSSAGDFNSDGVDDVIIAAGTGGFVVFGMQTSEPVTAITCNGLPVTVNLALGQPPTLGDDVIQGTEGADTIRALDGNDTICGLGGDDVIDAGGGDDFVDAGAGDDSVFGLSGADNLRGRSGADRIFGGEGEDLINGDGGADSLNGGGAEDLIFGGDGNDGVFGENGDDTLFGGDGDDLIAGAAGNDTLNGGAGSDRLVGDASANQAGDDTLDGGAGADELVGREGNDDCVVDNADTLSDC